MNTSIEYYCLPTDIGTHPPLQQGHCSPGSPKRFQKQLICKRINHRARIARKNPDKANSQHKTLIKCLGLGKYPWGTLSIVVCIKCLGLGKYPVVVFSSLSCFFFGLWGQGWKNPDHFYDACVSTSPRMSIPDTMHIRICPQTLLLYQKATWPSLEEKFQTIPHSLGDWRAKTSQPLLYRLGKEREPCARRDQCHRRRHGSTQDSEW